MNLIECLGLVLAQIGAGALLFSAWLPAREIRPGFFAFQSFLAAGLLAINPLLRGSDKVALSLTAASALGALIAGQAFRSESPRFGRALLLLAGGAGTVLVLAQIPVPQPPTGAALETEVGFLRFYPALFVLGGLLLLGATHTAMVLGHWYLLMRGLSFGHLVRFCRLAVGATVTRGALLLAAVALFSGRGADYGAFLLDRALRANSFFFGARIALGLVAPLAFGVMALRCAKMRANQAATGLLYLSEAFVFFGEMLAAYLLL